MEIRDIEIFLTLAKELHFGRTAERLHVTVARVSQAIKKQERQIGGALFARTSHHVSLTPLGQQLHDDLLPVHRGLQRSLERAALAAKGRTEVLRLGMTSSNVEDLRPVLDEFSSRHPACTVQIRAVGYNDPFAALRHDTIDVLLAWLPIREPDLTVGPVAYTEPVVLCGRSPEGRRQSTARNYSPSSPAGKRCAPCTRTRCATTGGLTSPTSRSMTPRSAAGP
ncbi:LysR family transcriptional regulator [Streptomyces sp. NBC_00249]|uniref:LysR family transcriptional regulator n=1 Tax=Streptomyces sp. NBC_00249 TaxID=2975690 RepID=UPI0022595B2D|nr:LysR family transcriptional regulator [Streptomyces sp. NBC_00249]MCX5197355.1 LysR family transcriptional regulator [Streptomyces sp. NBC_00249]